MIFPTRRAPDEVRAAPASTLGFANWLHGDGAKAWCALDQVPADRPYSMAAIVASALQNGIDPREWDRCQPQMREIAAKSDESFVPKPAGHRRRQPGDTARARPTDPGPRRSTAMNHDIDDTPGQHSATERQLRRLVVVVAESAADAPYKRLGVIRDPTSTCWPISCAGRPRPRHQPGANLYLATPRPGRPRPRPGTYEWEEGRSDRGPQSDR